MPVGPGTNGMNIRVNNLLRIGECGVSRSSFCSFVPLISLPYVALIANELCCLHM
jgi:hypothetical protein